MIAMYAWYCHHYEFSPAWEWFAQDAEHVSRHHWDTRDDDWWTWGVALGRRA